VSPKQPVVKESTAGIVSPPKTSPAPNAQPASAEPTSSNFAKLTHEANSTAPSISASVPPADFKPPTIGATPIAVADVPAKPPTPPAPAPKPAAKPKPSPIVNAPTSTGNRTRFVRLLLAVLILVMLIGGGVYGWRWYAKRKAANAATALKQKSEARRQAVIENFDADALHRLAAKAPKWTSAISSVPKLNGKAVVLSVTDSGAVTPKNDMELIKDFYDHGKFDELTFELPESAWAEGIGELETIVGIHWSLETAGVFKDGKVVEVTEKQMTSEQKSLPQAQRWHATVLILDLKSGTLTARKEFTGPLPASLPAQKKAASGPRPIDEIVQWL
jgi:hypothetical protein